MSIVTISRGSYSRGKEIAEKLARKLGYECISREILLEASQQFNMPEARLARALHDAPSILDRFTFGKERYAAYIGAAILRHMQKDNVVYHGLAGHFFLQDIPHVLKVRIVADLEDRVGEEMRRAGISADAARRILVKDDVERRRWSLHLYGIDTRDPSLYDMVLAIRRISPDDAVGIIAHSLQSRSFRTSPDSQRLLDNRALAAQVRAALVKDFPRVTASAEGARVVVSIHAPVGKMKEVGEEAERMARRVAGVEEVEVFPVPIITAD
jgi:cytidylate kinase